MIRTMIFPDCFRSSSLSALPVAAPIRRVLAAALSAVDPAAAIAACVQRDGDTLQVAGHSYHLQDYDQVLVVGAGKAGAAMGLALSAILGNAASGIIISKGTAITTETAQTGPIHYLKGGHPIPDGSSIESTRQLLALIDRATPRSLVFCLLSGGGSALMAAPLPGVTLADLQRLTEVMLACGASINEINTLRKHLDQVKGGRLAERIYPAQLITLILSDVVGSPLDVIASGPTVADSSTYQDALQILDRYGVREEVPASIAHALDQGCEGRLSETLKPGDPRLARVQNEIIASNLHAAQAGCWQAESEGFSSLLLTTYLQGEACLAGGVLASILRQVASPAGMGRLLPRPVCLVVGGETTVKVKGAGLGGRNLELALGSAKDLDGLEQVALVTLATDGEDGPTGAAGAVVTGETARRAAEAGLNPEDFLARNNSYHFFEPLGSLIITGPTGTNVNDLTFLFAY